jgi:hypothetical protein
LLGSNSSAYNSDRYGIPAQPSEKWKWVDANVVWNTAQVCEAEHYVFAYERHKGLIASLFKEPAARFKHRGSTAQAQTRRLEAFGSTRNAPDILYISVHYLYRNRKSGFAEQSAAVTDGAELTDHAEEAKLPIL